MAAEPDPQQLLTVLTTEHFTLQGARAQTVSESAARASLYLFSVSALVALPTLYVLGLFTFVRLVQSVAEDFQYGRAINRIRHHYLDVAGSKADLFMMSAHTRRARGARQHRPAGAQLPHDERDGQQPSHHERREHLDAAPTGRVAAHQSPDERQRGTGHEREAEWVGLRARAKLSSIRPSASAISASATGTLSQKIYGHAIPSTTGPPNNGPSGTPTPETPAKTPSALGRSRGANAAPSSASASGITSAAPAPWTARAAISQPTSGERAHPAEAAASSPTPTQNVRRRPNRSPSTAPVMSSTAKLSVYALTVHSSCCTDAWRSKRIVLSAVETTSASRTTISDGGHRKHPALRRPPRLVCDAGSSH
jgi:hypothetical protein